MITMTAMITSSTYSRFRGMAASYPVSAMEMAVPRMIAAKTARNSAATMGQHDQRRCRPVPHDGSLVTYFPYSAAQLICRNVFRTYARSAASLASRAFRSAPVSPGGGREMPMT
jgi:hypothetical protein